MRGRATPFDIRRRYVEPSACQSWQSVGDVGAWRFRRCSTAFPKLLVIGTALAFAASISTAKEPPRDRRAFAREMGKIKEGMPQAEVIKILGPPDDVLTRKDVQGLNDALEILRDGASGHMKPATLAQISIDGEHRAVNPFTVWECLRRKACLRSPSCGESSRRSRTFLD